MSTTKNNVISIASRKDDTSLAKTNRDLRSGVAGGNEPVGRTMGSNVARDILKRSSDFRDFGCMAFEYIANGHEAYQIDDLDREVIIDITKGSKGRIQISDNGCGMHLESLVKFWTMHAETSRREQGLNLRGYNGTGKIAGFKYFNVLTLETIKDGLRNVTRLNRRHIEEMAKTSGAVQIEEVAVNEPTDLTNGTTVILSNPISAISTAQIIELRAKIAMEMMMWMKGTKVILNDEAVEPEAISFDETESVSSECGSFSGSIYYLDKGYSQEMQKIFISADRVFMASENFGKEGHRFSSKVHAVFTASPEWYAEFFEGRREQFVSEARDLKLKLSHPEAARYRDFIETSIRSFMKMLDEREKERQQKQLDEKMRAMQDKLSRLFSSLSDRLNFKRRMEQEIKRSEDPKPRERSDNTRDRKPKIDVKLREFENDQSEYRVDPEFGVIEVNLKAPHLSGISENRADATFDQAVLEIVKTAFVELETSRRMVEAWNDRSLDVKTYLDEQSAVGGEVRITVNTMLTESFRVFQSRRQA
ncbi:hypothetical protein G6L37_00770 [Agrobacterium rubi]|nr:hypothetical protein [Agrobacterium rubi]NTF23923.1 hypothetical protein [Agrobacterium rubi]